MPNQAFLSLVLRLSVRAFLAPLFLTNLPERLVRPLATPNPGKNPPFCFTPHCRLLMIRHRRLPGMTDSFTWRAWHFYDLGGAVWISTHVRSELDQRLFVGGVREMTHVHLDREISEIVPSFDQRPQRSQSDHPATVFPHGSHHQTHGQDQEVQAVEKTVEAFVVIKHLTSVPPLMVPPLIRVQSIQRSQRVCVQTVRAMQPVQERHILHRFSFAHWSNCWSLPDVHCLCRWWCWWWWYQQCVVLDPLGARRSTRVPIVVVDPCVVLSDRFHHCFHHYCIRCHRHHVLVSVFVFYRHHYSFFDCPRRWGDEGVFWRGRRRGCFLTIVGRTVGVVNGGVLAGSPDPTPARLFPWLGTFGVGSVEWEEGVPASAGGLLMGMGVHDLAHVVVGPHTQPVTSWHALRVGIDDVPQWSFLVGLVG